MSADREIRHALLDLVEPTDDESTADDVWSGLTRRRRRRRVRRATLVALPVLLLVAAVGVNVLTGEDAPREVAAGGDGATDGWTDFDPFEMTYRISSSDDSGARFSTWRLGYRSAEEWTQELVDAGPTDPAYHRAVLGDGRLTRFDEDGEPLEVEEVDGPKAPLALLSKGPWGGEPPPDGGDVVHRIETQECGAPEAPIVDRSCRPDDPTYLIRTKTRYNSAGVPILSQEVVVETGQIRWGYELLEFRSEVPAPDPGTPPVEPVWESDALGLGSWEGTRTSADGRSLLIVFVGGRTFDPDDPCSHDYRAVVEESGDEVRVSIESRSPPPPMGTTEFGCTAEGYFRTVTAALTEPLGERALVEDQFNRVHDVFDGTRLFEPTWLPDGWEMTNEGAWYAGERGDGRSWGRTWGGPTPEPVDDRCVAGEEAISVIQTDSATLEANPPYGLEPTATHDVNGAEATHWTGGPYDLQALTWTVGDEGFLLQPQASCADDPPTSIDRLLQFARGLQPAR